MRFRAFPRAACNARGEDPAQSYHPDAPSTFVKSGQFSHLVARTSWRTQRRPRLRLEAAARLRRQLTTIFPCMKGWMLQWYG